MNEGSSSQKKGKKIKDKGNFFLLSSSAKKWREAPGDPSHMAGTHTNAARYTLPIFLIIDTRNCSTGHSLSIAYTRARYQKLLTDVYVWIMPRTKKKAAVELDDRNVATLALLGLRQMNGQAANKKQRAKQHYRGASVFHQWQDAKESQKSLRLLRRSVPHLQRANSGKRREQIC